MLTDTWRGGVRVRVIGKSHEADLKPISLLRFQVQKILHDQTNTALHCKHLTYCHCTPDILIIIPTMAETKTKGCGSLLFTPVNHFKGLDFWTHCHSTYFNGQDFFAFESWTNNILWGTYCSFH